MRRILAVLILSLLIGVPGTAQGPQDSCVTCHSAMPSPTSEPAKLFAGDVHRQAGLGCADCHGGDPKDASMNAMSPAKGFRGAPKKTQIPEFCARCHADPGTMRKYNPGIRTDQLSEYLTSVHGKRLKQGDTNAATCVDCHSVHDILPVSDPRAPVYATNVASTCAKCHADAARMKDYKIPTNQFALYSRSVHAKALAGGDTAAPTCTTCHGNHGATPPGVTSVANVCGTCHAFNQQLFEKSPHQAAFAKMGLPGCVQCHSNHGIVEPTDDWVGTGDKALCIQCHAKGDAGYAAAQQMADDIASLEAGQKKAQGIIDEAELSGMEVSNAKVQLTDAHADLIKARVNIHTFNPAEVRKLTEEGAKIDRQAYDAGVAALHERDYRRKGLGVALVFIILAISGLYLKIRQIESRSQG